MNLVPGLDPAGRFRGEGWPPLGRWVGGIRMGLRSFRVARIALLATALLVAGTQPPAAAAGRARGAKHLRVVSGPSPFAAGCPGAALDETHVAGDEIEPAITVNPANPRNIVATWQQDLGFTARSDLIG